MSERRPELSKLEPFVGTWNTTGTIQTDAGPALELSGTDTYEWFEGGHFLVHRADVSLGGKPSRTLEVISYDRDTESFCMRFFDTEGETGMMIATVDGPRWIFLGETLRFEGAFDSGSRSFSGRWEKREGETWVRLMEIRLDRV